MRAVVIACVLAGCRLGFEAAADGDAPTSDGASPVVQVLRLDRVAAPALVGYALLVVLDDTRADRTRLAGDAHDLRFYDADGAVLPHEIEQVGQVGGEPLVAWVRVPLLTGLTTTISMSYGAEPPPASTSSVWDGDHEAVWHLAADQPGKDASEDHPATATGTSAAQGVIGTGRRFNTANRDYMSAAASSFAPTAFTVTAWMYSDTVPSAGVYYGAVTRQAMTGSSNELFVGTLGGTAFCETFVGSGSQRFGMGTTVPASTWTFLAVTANATELRIYQDGVLLATTATGAALVTSGNPILLGADNNGSVAAGLADADWMTGMLDEVRIYRSVRSAEALAYDLAAQRDQVIRY